MNVTELLTRRNVTICYDLFLILPFTTFYPFISCYLVSLFSKFSIYFNSLLIFKKSSAVPKIAQNRNSFLQSTNFRLLPKPFFSHNFPQYNAFVISFLIIERLKLCITVTATTNIESNTL